jgi:hypothetical protein
MPVCVAVSILLAAPVSAEPQPTKTLGVPATAVPEQEAARRYDEGAKAARAGKWEKAREAFQEALRLKPDPVAAGRLGEAAFRTGRYVEAAQHLTWFLREATAASPDDRQAAEKMLAEAKAKIGTVTVRVDVAGADVLADGRPVGKSPLAGPVFVEPGFRQFKATKDEYGAEGRGIEIAAGSSPEVELTLTLPSRQPIAQQPAAAPTPPIMQAPITETQPAPVPVPAPSTAAPKWRTWAIVGGAGLTVVGIGVGAGLTVAANGKSTDADEQLEQIRNKTPTTHTLCGPKGFPLNTDACAELKDTLSAQDRLTNGAVAMYVVGGVAAVGTAMLFLWPRFQRPRTGIQIVPVVARGQSGMIVTGSF